MSIVNWTDAQLQCVAKMAVELMERDRLMPLSRAVFQAQNVYVPMHNRLAERSFRNYQQHHPKLRTVLESLKVVYPLRAEGVVGGLEKFVRQKSRIPTRTFTRAPPPPLVSNTPMPVAEPRYTLPEALALLQPTIQGLVRTELERLLGEPLSARPQVAEPVSVQAESVVVLDQHPQQRRSKKTVRNGRRILVIGGLGGQNEELLRRFPSLRLRFWNRESMEQLSSCCQWAETIVLMTSFINHGVSNFLRSNDYKPEYADGGLSSVIRVISKAIETEQGITS